MSSSTCFVCGAAGHSCGPAGTALKPIDLEEARTMTNEKPGKLVRARGIVNGYEATLQVTEAEAKRRGLEIVTPTAAKTKARSPEPATADVKTKTRSTTRKASTKKAGA